MKNLLYFVLFLEFFLNVFNKKIKLKSKLTSLFKMGSLMSLSDSKENYSTYFPEFLSKKEENKQINKNYSFEGKIKLINYSLNQTRFYNNSISHSNIVYYKIQNNFFNITEKVN